MGRSQITAAILVGATLLAGLAAYGAPPKKPKSDDSHESKKNSFKPVMSVEKLMEGQGRLFKDVKDQVLDNSWKDAETSAWLLAELANVNHYQSPDPKYRRYADRMSDECVKLARSLGRRDEAAARASVTALGERCQDCHSDFRKRRGPRPGGGRDH